MVLPKKNEDLIPIVRKGLRAGDELYILENGVADVIAMCEHFLSLDREVAEEHCRLSGTEWDSWSADIRSIREMAESMWTIAQQDAAERYGQIRLQCLILGFEAVDRQNSAVRQMLPEDTPARPTEIFVSETRKRLKRIISYGQDAMEFLALKNRNLIATTAKSVCGSARRDGALVGDKEIDRELFEELTSICHYEFVDCAYRKWDPERGTMFSTLVTTSMKLRCLQYLATRGMIRLPNANIGLANKLRRGEVDVECSDIADPKKRREEREKRRAVSTCLQDHRSLEESFGDGDDDGGTILSDVIVQIGEESADDIIRRMAIAELISELADRLPSPRREILKMRLSSVEGDPDDVGTLEKIAARLHEMGISKAVTRQRIQQHMKKIQKLFLKHLTSYHPDMVEEFDLENEIAEIVGGK